MLHLLFSESGLRDLSSKCAALALQVNESEAGMCKLAAESFSNAAKYFNEPDPFWYRHNTLSAYNSFQIARLTSQLNADQGLPDTRFLYDTIFN